MVLYKFVFVEKFVLICICRKNLCNFVFFEKICINLYLLKNSPKVVGCSPTDWSPNLVRSTSVKSDKSVAYKCLNISKEEEKNSWMNGTIFLSFFLARIPSCVFLVHHRYNPLKPKENRHCSSVNGKESLYKNIRPFLLLVKDKSPFPEPDPLFGAECWVQQEKGKWCNQS